MRVCRYCDRVAGDGGSDICPGPDGLVTSHSWVEEDGEPSEGELERIADRVGVPRWEQFS
jgi:hypothetical protein